MILEGRLGITELASIKYRDEAAILAQSSNPEEEYRNRVLPDKIQLSSFSFDLALILKTLLKLSGGCNKLVEAEERIANRQ